MFETNRKTLYPAVRLASLACALTIFAGGLSAQSTTDNSGQTGAAAPGTAPVGQSTSGQTNAAPGSAPIKPRVLATRLAPPKVATYDERWEFFGGLSLMNGQAGQNIPKRYNMGGGEAMATYWLGSRHVPRLGVVGDYRFGAGTTPVLPNPLGLNRVLVFQNIFSGGAEYRGPKNRYASVDFHALVGASHGTFSHAIDNHPPTGTPFNDATVGLYNDSTTPWGAAGGSIDFNTAPRLAVRLSPDIVFEHFGTETREFVAVSGGVIYRFGKRR